MRGKWGTRQGLQSQGIQGTVLLAFRVLQGEPQTGANQWQWKPLPESGQFHLLRLGVPGNVSWPWTVWAVDRSRVYRSSHLALPTKPARPMVASGLCICFLFACLFWTQMQQECLSLLIAPYFHLSIHSILCQGEEWKGVSWSAPDKGWVVVCFLFFLIFYYLLFLLSNTFFSVSLSSSPLTFSPLLWTPCSQFNQKILSFSPSCGDPCMSLLGSSVSSRFSGVVECRLVFVCFTSKSHLWLTTYYICLPQYSFCQVFPWPFPMTHCGGRCLPWPMSLPLLWVTSFIYSFTHSLTHSFILSLHLARYPWVALNSASFCFWLLSAGITGLQHYAHPRELQFSLILAFVWGPLNYALLISRSHPMS